MAALSWAELAGEMVAMALLLAASGFFSGSETALFNLSRGQLHRMRHSTRPGRVISALMRRPARVLNTLLLGNMIVNVVYAGISAVLVIQLGRSGGFPAWAVVMFSLVPLVVLILVGEVAPKMLALVLGQRWALLAAGPLAMIERASRPVLRVVDGWLVSPLTRLIAPRRPAPADITAEELDALLDLSAKRGIIDHDANALLQEMVELTDLRVGDIMVPRVDMIAYDVNDPPEGLIELFRRTRLRKIPVYDGEIDRVLGVVHAKRLLLNPTAELRRLVVQVPFMPEAGSVERALVQFRVRHKQMAIVVDEYGGVAGLVTLEDVLEEIVGDIPDPADAARGPAVERIGDREYRIDGNLAIHEWVDAFNIDLSGQRISTIGGFVTLLLGRIPRVGDAADYRNLTFTVESMRKRRVGRLRVTRREGGA